MKKEFINGIDTLSPFTVCWIDVKVEVWCASQYMPWNLLTIKVLNSFWYFELPIFEKRKKYNFMRQFLLQCHKYASEQDLVEIWCLKYQKLFKTLIRSRFQGMYRCAHKTATLTLIQHTVPPRRFVNYVKENISWDRQPTSIAPHQDFSTFCRLWTVQHKPMLEFVTTISEDVRNSANREKWKKM